MSSSALKIARHFDRASFSYDAQASLQAQVATQLVRSARSHLQQPQSLLDIGCGTGFVTEALRKQWPEAQLTAVDSAPNMLRQAEQKVKPLMTIRGDASTIEFTQKFDAVFSSMMLHWLPDPLDVLQRWQSWLKPNGKIFVALLVEGSFQEWRDLCCAHTVADGLWPMPNPNFTETMPFDKRQEAVTITYASAQDFLHRLKSTGAATPRQDHVPFTAPQMRNLLRVAPKPFPITYQVLYIENSLQGSV